MDHWQWIVIKSLKQLEQQFPVLILQMFKLLFRRYQAAVIVATLPHSVFSVSPKVHSRDARGKAGSSNSGGSLQQEMLQHAKACVQPGLDYFENI